jgi:hypothetical protein
VAEQDGTPQVIADAQRAIGSITEKLAAQVPRELLGAQAT